MNSTPIIFVDKLRYIVGNFNDQIAHHPWMEAISGMKINEKQLIEAFKYWLVQDYLYLKSYEKVIDLAIQHANTDLKLKEYLQERKKSTNNFKEYIKRLAQKQGISNEELEEAPKCFIIDEYTEFAESQADLGIAEAFTMLLACQWTYFIIGKKLESTFSWIEGSYSSCSDWIDMFVSREITPNELSVPKCKPTSTEWYLKKLIEFSKSLKPDDISRLAMNFEKACNYEFNFLNAAWFQLP